MPRKVTINMVADRAGVSRGTVDRVLNQRPHVKPELYDRVILAMKELGYVPPHKNQAVALGLPTDSIEPCQLGILLRNERGYFKSEVIRGIEAAQKQLHDFQVNIVLEECSTSLPEEIIERLNSLVAQGVKGIALSVIDHESIASKVNELIKQGIAVVTFNTDLTNCNRMCFIGQDLLRSGRIAGELMSKCINLEDTLLIAIGNPEFHAHRLRLQGFCERVYEKGFSGGNLQIIETYNDYSLTYQKIKAALQSTQNIKGIYMANHSVTGCVQAVRDMNLSGKLHVISHDLTDATRRLLQFGEIDFAISQDICQQSYQSLITLQQYVQKNISPDCKEQHPAIDIFCSENL